MRRCPAVRADTNARRAVATGFSGDSNTPRSTHAIHPVRAAAARDGGRTPTVTSKPSRKQLIDAAIAFALNRDWERASIANRTLLEEQPNDIEAANRLGKALTELGDYPGAIAAYEQALRADPINVIAQKNIQRLQESGERTPVKRPRTRKPVPGAPAALRPHALIEESGRSAEFTLQRPNVRALARVATGDPAELTLTPTGVAVQSTTGAALGNIEPRAGARLRRLIEGGNQYAVVIRHVDRQSITVYVRETFRDPSQADQTSFLQPSNGRRRALPRPYTKQSVIRRERDDGEEPEDDGEDAGWTPRRAARDEEDAVGDAVDEAADEEFEGSIDGLDDDDGFGVEDADAEDE